MEELREIPIVISRNGSISIHIFVVKKILDGFLGWMLANLGKKVLIVDADPQCDLTGLTLGIDSYDDLFTFYSLKGNHDMYSSLAESFGFPSDSVAGNTKGVEPTATKNRNLALLAGHIDFAKFDLQLATALTSGNAIPVLRPLLSSINTLIRKTAERGNFDIVLVDMSPSISATNMCIFMASDYFIIPTSPDFYCYQAIDSLSEVLPEWSTRMMPFKDDTTNKEIKEKSLKCMIRPIGVSSYKLAEKNELPKELEGIKELEGLM